jgi:hypothetical protein
MSQPKAAALEKSHQEPATSGDESGDGSVEVAPTKTSLRTAKSCDLDPPTPTDAGITLANGAGPKEPAPRVNVADPSTD